MKIEICSEPPHEIAEALSRGIVDFNRASVPDLEPNEAEVKFHVVANDRSGLLEGGLRASCYWNTLHIELLWLPESSRGSGLGKRIVKEAEQEARRVGCEKALVETTSWQAKPFYEGLGYRLMGTLEGRPKGHASHYLTKTL